ncbi:EF-hand domain-containing protein [Nephila pilipes]|uniref:EF-hand domain-containing protein n=1 Tax=Nephila pilipes TaxID=299642 RepID=A0A8X6QFZ5_NEPPI|nr:EF-hand domain-containing protein [Nephila pilipes]
MASEKNLQAAFEIFCKAEGGKDGKLSVDGMKKWFRQAGIITKDTGITDTDVDKAFSVVVENKEGVTFTELKECVISIAKDKNLDHKELLNKLGEAGQVQSAEENKLGK